MVYIRLLKKKQSLVQDVGRISSEQSAHQFGEATRSSFVHANPVELVSCMLTVYGAGCLEPYQATFQLEKIAEGTPVSEESSARYRELCQRLPHHEYRRYCISNIVRVSLQ